MLSLLQQIPPFQALESGILTLKSQAESISKQLGAWTRMLLDSELKGQRYVTERAEFLDFLPSPLGRGWRSRSGERRVRGHGSSV